MTDKRVIVAVREKWMRGDDFNAAMGEHMLSDYRETLLRTNTTRMEEIEEFAFYGEPNIRFENDTEREYYEFIQSELGLETHG